MKFVSDGIIQVHYLPSVENIAEPTLAEIAGGVNLTPFLRSIDTPLEGSAVDAATAESAFNSTVRGTYGGQPVTGEFTRDKVKANDTAWNTLPFGTEGFFLVARRGGTGSNGALAATDEVDVFPIDVTGRNPVAYGRNELARFALQAAVPAPPEFDAVVSIGGGS